MNLNILDIRIKSNAKLIVLLSYVIGMLHIPNSLHGQFLDKNAKWTVMHEQYGGSPIKKFYDIEIHSDSLIDNVLYSIFSEFEGLYALREENNKVFYKILQSSYSGTDTSEYLLYNFDLIIGDTISLHFPMFNTLRDSVWYVTKVDSVPVGDTNKKRILLEVPNLPGPGNWFYWIEDVGSTEGPLWFTAKTEHEFLSALTCYYLEGNVVYRNEGYSQCKTLGSNELNSRYNEDVFEYNALFNTIKVNLPVHDSFEFSIYSMNGTKVVSKKVPVYQIIQLNGINTGYYIVEVRTKTNRFNKKIFIK